MPALAFASNFIWVMVIGLLGPSLPAIISELGISYAQAGFLFTLLSLGSLVGSLGAASAADRLPRKALYAACAALFVGGLAGLGVMHTYVPVAVFVFMASLAGSPLSAVGQSIMLGMFPDRRERNLSVMTSLGAVGSLLAPFLVSTNLSTGIGWRWSFLEVAILAAALCAAILVVRIPAAGPPRQVHSAIAILRNRWVAAAALMIFVSVGADLGFSYWLAQFFSAELHVSRVLSSSVVGLYLAGIIVGRALMPRVLKRLSIERHLVASLTIAVGAILLFVLVPSPGAKAGLCTLYGFGIGPLFPLLLARGTQEFPEQTGAVTGILFAGMSLGGMVFPLLLGVLAERVGIARSYGLSAALAFGLLIVAAVMSRKPGPTPAAPASRPRQS